jgi:hypothetical protein
MTYGQMALAGLLEEAQGLRDRACFQGSIQFIEAIVGRLRK